MAVIAYSKVTPVDGSQLPVGVVIYKWTLASGDTGAPVTVPHHSDKTVQVYDGTWGDGTFTLEGSLQADLAPASVTEWDTLTDPQGGNISKTADFTEAVLENTYYVRPALSGTTGTGIVVYLQVTTIARR